MINKIKDYKDSENYNDNYPAVTAIVGYLLTEDEPSKIEDIIENYDKGYDISIGGSNPYFDSKWGNWLPGDEGEAGFISADDWKDWKKYIPEIVKELLEEGVLIGTEDAFKLNTKLKNIPTDPDELADEVAEYYAGLDDWDYDPY